MYRPRGNIDDAYLTVEQLTESATRVWRPNPIKYNNTVSNSIWFYAKPGESNTYSIRMSYTYITLDRKEISDGTLTKDGLVCKIGNVS